MYRKLRIKSSVSSEAQAWWQWLIILVVITVVVSVAGISWRLFSGRQWDGKNRLTWIVGDQQVGSDLELWSLEPGTGLTVVQLPAEVRVTTVYGYGDYLIAGLYGLAKQEKKMELLTKTIEYELGVPVEGYLITLNKRTSEQKNKEKDQFIKGFKSEMREWWMGEVDSNLSWGDKVMVWYEARKLRFDQIQLVDFAVGNWARKEVDVDGQPVIWFDRLTVDSRLPAWVADVKVISENVQVRIVNTTKVAGLGNQIARIATGLGVKVIEVRDSQGGEVDQCVIRTVEQRWKESYAGRRLGKIFNCQWEDIGENDQRVDIELRIGREQARVWRGVTNLGH